MYNKKEHESSLEYKVKRNLRNLKNGLTKKLYGKFGIFFSQSKKRWLVTTRKSDIQYARVIMENLLNRPLSTLEHVHHKDFNSTNDDLKNLVVCTKAEHSRIHMKVRRQLWM